MTWRDLFHIDLGGLLRGKVELTRPRWVLLPARNLFLEFLLTPFRWVVDLLGLLRGMRQIRRIMVTEQIARIVACNAPMVPALEATLVDTPNRRGWLALQRLRTALAQGASLAEAMRRQPRFFPRYYVDLVQAGEDTGSLYPTLVNLAEGLGESLRMRDAVRTCLLYFAFLLAVGGTILWFILLKIMPVFAEVFRDFVGELPYPTRVLVALGDWVSYRWANALLIIGVSGAVIAVIYKLIGWLDRRNRHFGYAWDRFVLWMPFFGTVFAQSSLAHAAAILEKLLRAGYPLDEALASAVQSDIRPLFTRLLNRVRDRVRQGASFAEAVNREAGVVPASFRGMVALGESSGRLPNTLGRLALLYQRRVVKVMHVTASIAFPIGILVAGCCVLMVYSSVFIAVAGIADTIIGNI